MCYFIMVNICMYLPIALSQTEAIIYFHYVLHCVIFFNYQLRFSTIKH
jgi:hypothetical protein